LIQVAHKFGVDSRSLAYTKRVGTIRIRSVARLWMARRSDVRALRIRRGFESGLQESEVVEAFFGDAIPLRLIIKKAISRRQLACTCGT